MSWKNINTSKMQERNKSHFGICSVIDLEIENILILRIIAIKARNCKVVDLLYNKKAH
jgi:hypothetical protein